MRRIARYLIALGLITLMLSTFWVHRVRAAREAAEFAPADTNVVVLPAGTVIEATINYGISSSADAGDAVTAIVSTPVLMDERLVIPSGAVLRGNLQNLVFFKDKARADVRFTDLTIRGRHFRIKTRRVALIAPVLGQFDILGSGLKALVGAGFGASIGAASGDGEMVNKGLVGGVISSVAPVLPVSIAVVLVQDVDV